MAAIFVACSDDSEDKPVFTPKATANITLTRGDILGPIDRHEITITRNGTEVARESDSAFNYGALAAQVQDEDNITIEGRAYARRSYANGKNAQGDSVVSLSGYYMDNDARQDIENAPPVDGDMLVRVGKIDLTLSGAEFKEQKAYSLGLEPEFPTIKFYVDLTKLDTLQYEIPTIIYFQRKTIEEADYDLIVAHDWSKKEDGGTRFIRVYIPEGGRRSFKDGLDMVISTKSPVLYMTPAEMPVFRVRVDADFFRASYIADRPLVWREGETLELGTLTLEEL